MCAGVANSIDLCERTLPYLEQNNCKPEHVHFSAYDKDQLVQLLLHQLQAAHTSSSNDSAVEHGDDCNAEAEHRVKAGKRDWKVGLQQVELDAGAIEMCARKVAAVSGDARKLLALASRCFAVPRAVARQYIFLCV
jgi:cell division control protein 6